MNKNKHPTREDWEKLASNLTFPHQAFINGEYVDALSGATFACESPIDGRVLTQVASCDAADADRAVKAARTAFESGVWRNLPPAKRKQILLKFASLITAHRDELALLETLDMGKPIRFSGSVDVGGAARAISWTAEAIDKVYNELAPTPADQIGMITREAVGVVVAIVPWNFPLLMASWKFAPALAMGNSVILKPSEKSPLTALHMDVDTLAFTGSTAVAKQLMVYAGESNMKRVWLEAGGKSPNIVFADAPNLEKAAEAAAQGIAFNMGQVCTAGTRLLVEASIKDKFVDLVNKALAKWQPGHPLDPSTLNGAIVDKQQLTKVLSYIEKGQQEEQKKFLARCLAY